MVSNALKPSPRSTVARLAREMLRLLAREGPAEELTQLVAGSRSALTGDADVESVREMADLASSVLTALDQRRRRQVALTALFESAIDLAAVRDLDEMLDAIVRRTRRVLHVDVAYLSLITDGGDDIGLRVTTGCVSPTFKRLRIRIEDCIGGLVTRSGMPVTHAQLLHGNPHQPHGCD